MKRLIMPGVKIAEGDAFVECTALADVECGKLEIIKDCAFQFCESLRSINLPSVKTVESYVFSKCQVLTDVKFGNNLETIEEAAFYKCRSLERITIPSKNGLFTNDDIFTGCVALKHFDLIEGRTT